MAWYAETFQEIIFGWHRAGENYFDILIQKSVSY